MLCESEFSVRENTASSMNTLIKVKNALDSSECAVEVMNAFTSLAKGSVTFSWKFNFSDTFLLELKKLEYTLV